MKKRNIVIVGIILLSSLLVFSYMANQTKAFAQAKDGCGGCCAMKAACAEQAQCCADCDMQCQKCKCCTDGPARAKYLENTAGLRKELADARAELDAAMRKRPVDKAQVVGIVDRVNALQGKLNRQTVEYMIDTCCSASEKPCCETCSPSVCMMMLADECPMKMMACKKANGSCGPTGCKPK